MVQKLIYSLPYGLQESNCTINFYLVALVFGTTGSICWIFFSIFSGLLTLTWTLFAFLQNKVWSILMIYLYFRRKDSRAQCRGCFFCVARCETCGGCIDLEELSETELACSDFLCMECWLLLPKCSTCNRPYCKRHENLKVDLSPSGQFTCHRCVEFSSNSRENLEESS